MIYIELLISFARANFFGFGGGPSLIPLIMREVIDIRGWMTFEQFMDAYAFGNSLPSPISTKLAAYAGYHVAGWAGALAALFGTITPTLVVTVFLFQLYKRYRHNRQIGNFLEGVRPAVLALLLMVVFQFIPASFPAGNNNLQQAGLIGIGIGSFLLFRKKLLHPIVIIGLAGLAGLLLSGTK